MMAPLSGNRLTAQAAAAPTSMKALRSLTTTRSRPLPPSAVLLALMPLLLAMITTATAAVTVAASNAASLSVTAVTGGVKFGAQRLLQQQASGSWVPAVGCIPERPCTSSGTCLKSNLVTLTSMSPTGGCGLGAHEESMQAIASSTCRWTGCNYKNCASDEIEASSKWCGFAFNEWCCKKQYTYTCRQILSCQWVNSNPARSPPPNTAAVLAAGGAWDPYATTNKRTNAYITAILSTLIYASHFGDDISDALFETLFRNRIAQLGATRTRLRIPAPEEPYDDEYAMVETPNSIVVVFRGTETTSIEDLLSGAASLATSAANEFGGSGVRIGTGFYRVFAGRKTSFLAELRVFISSGSSSRGKPLWFAGHSLGGAFANLFGAFAHLNGFPVAGVYTFGAPIVGNTAWKLAYPLSGRTYRYAASEDPITKLPVGISWSADNHVGLLVSSDPCAASRAATAAGTGGTGGRRLHALTDHNMYKSYAANIYFCSLTREEAAVMPRFPF